MSDARRGWRTSSLVVLAACLAWALTGRVVASQDGFPSILATAEGDHAWMVVPDTSVPDPAASASAAAERPACHLLHFAREGGPTAGRVIRSFSRWPQAIASLGDRLWIIFPPQDARRSARDVLSLSVVWNEAVEAYYAIPIGRLEIQASLPLQARIAGLASSENMLHAVILPSKRAARGITREPEEDNDQKAPADDPEETVAASSETDEALSLVPQGADAPPKLLGLRVSGWIPLETPPGLGPVKDVLLGTADVLGKRGLAMAWAAEDGHVRLAVGSDFSSGADTEESKWTESTVAVPYKDLHAILRLQEGGTVLVHGADEVGFSYLRPGGELAAIASVPMPDDPWAIGVLGGVPQLFERQADIFSVTTVGPLGTIGETVKVEEMAGNTDWIYGPLAVIVFLCILLAVPLTRPFIESAPVDPVSTLKPLPLFGRMAALVIDFIPGAVIATIAFSIGPIELVESFRPFELSAGPAALVALGATGLFAGVFEVIWGRSLGKMIVGGEVARLDGTRPSRLQLGLRAVLKMAVLLAPLVAILVVLDPLSRGLPELISRTVVASRKRSGTKNGDLPSPGDSDGG